MLHLPNTPTRLKLLFFRCTQMKKSSHFFARSVPQEKRQKKWLNGQKSGLTDKKVDLNGQKKYPNGTKIVRWFHYFCPLVQFWFLFQAGTFFAAFLGGPSKGVAKNTLGTQCMKSSKRRLAQILPTYPPKN